MASRTGFTTHAAEPEYDDAVLRANWLCCPGTDESPRGRDCSVRSSALSPLDADSFLDTYYRNQE